MNKKINFLAVLPLYGAIIVLFWLFIKLFKNEINKKKFTLYFYSCGFVGGISVMLSILVVLFLNYQFKFSEEHLIIAIIVALILGGYLMNLFTFLLLNKKWGKLKV